MGNIEYENCDRFMYRYLLHVMNRCFPRDRMCPQPSVVEVVGEEASGEGAGERVPCLGPLRAEVLLAVVGGEGAGAASTGVAGEPVVRRLEAGVGGVEEEVPLVAGVAIEVAGEQDTRLTINFIYSNI